MRCEVCVVQGGDLRVVQARLVRVRVRVGVGVRARVRARVRVRRLACSAGTPG